MYRKVAKLLRRVPVCCAHRSFPGLWATVRSQHGSVVMNPSRDLVCTSSGSPSPHPLSVPGSHQDPTWCLVVLPRFLVLLFTLSVSSSSGTTLTVLRSADQGSCRMSLSVGVTDVFLTTRLWVVGLRRPPGTCHSHCTLLGGWRPRPTADADFHSPG